MKFNCVEKPLRWLFRRHGRFIGRHPAPFLIIPVLISAILATGVFVAFTEETDPEALFGPEGSQSRQNREILRDLYSEVVDENMLPRQRLGMGMWATTIVTAKSDSLDDDILSRPNLMEVARFHESVLNVSVELENLEYRFEDICMGFNGACNKDGGWTILEQLQSVDNYTLTFPAANKSNGETFFAASSVGGVTLAQDNTVVEKAEALLLTYQLRFDTEEEAEISRVWEMEFGDHVGRFDSDKISVYYITVTSFTETLSESTGVPFHYYVIIIVNVAVFSILSTSMVDWVRTKPYLALMGLFVTGLALASSLGSLAYSGVPFASTAAAMPLLILGIGIDDMFIMISAWRQTSVHKSVPERMSKAMEESALSITITSVTDAMAFGLGCTTNFLSIRLFCIYACVATMFCYLYMITFFAACVVLTGYREESNRHALTFRKVVPKKTAASMAYKLCCAGGSSETEAPLNIRKATNDQNDDESANTALMIFFKKFYGPFVTHPCMAAVVIVAFLAYLGVAIWGCLFLVEGGELQGNVGNDGSHLNLYFKKEFEYFKRYGPHMSVVALSELDYWSPDVQNELENVMEKLETSKYFYDSSYSTSWLRQYLTFLDILQIKEPSKDVFLRILREQFLALHVYQQFVPDIIFDSTNQSIISSRFYVLGKDIDRSDEERDMFLLTRRVCAKSDLDLIVYNPFAVWIHEQFAAIRSNTIITMSIGVASMFFIALILIPHPIGAIIITLSVVSTLIGVVGYMSHLDIPLDTISMVTLIVSIGFSVDFSAHISYAYTAGPHQERRRNSLHALHHLGAATLQGAISTILAVCVFFFTDSYIQQTFFWTMFLVMTIGSLHGLVFLPVFLMLFVSNNNRDAPEGTATIRTTSSSNEVSSRASFDGKYYDTDDEPPAYSNRAFSISSRLDLQQRKPSYEIGPVDLQRRPPYEITPVNARKQIDTFWDDWDVAEIVSCDDNTVSYPSRMGKIVYNYNGRRPRLGPRFTHTDTESTAWSRTTSRRTSEVPSTNGGSTAQDSYFRRGSHNNRRSTDARRASDSQNASSGIDARTASDSQNASSDIDARTASDSQNPSSGTDAPTVIESAYSYISRTVHDPVTKSSSVQWPSS